MSEFPESLTVNVISQNMLLDKTRQNNGLILPQHQRIGAFVETLSNYPGELDVIGVQEVQGVNGQLIAEQAGLDNGTWVKHNEPQPGSRKGRSDEYIGMFGTLVESAESIDLGDNRKAVVASIADVAFILLHLRAGPSPSACVARRLQAKTVIEYADSFEDAVIFGDFNEPRLEIIPMARTLFKNNDFESVFEATNQPRPKTFPSAPYAHLYPPIRFALDDILVRGDRVKVLSAGVLQRASDSAIQEDGKVPLAESDHDGIWSTLRINTA